MQIIVPPKHKYIAGKSPLTKVIKNPSELILEAARRLTRCKSCGLFPGGEWHI